MDDIDFQVLGYKFGWDNNINKLEISLPIPCNFKNSFIVLYSTFQN